MIKTGSTHIVLLQFVSAEDYQAARMMIAQHDFYEFLSERSRAARYQDDLF
jgi:hypothetical protein